MNRSVEKGVYDLCTCFGFRPSEANRRPVGRLHALYYACASVARGRKGSREKVAGRE